MQHKVKYMVMVEYTVVLESDSEEPPHTVPVNLTMEAEEVPGYEFVSDGIVIVGQQEIKEGSR